MGGGPQVAKARQVVAQSRAEATEARAEAFSARPLENGRRNPRMSDDKRVLHFVSTCGATSKWRLLCFGTVFFRIPKSRQSTQDHRCLEPDWFQIGGTKLAWG